MNSIFTLLDICVNPVLILLCLSPQFPHPCHVALLLFLLLVQSVCQTKIPVMGGSVSIFHLSVCSVCAFAVCVREQIVCMHFEVQ